ncbi:HASPIN protein kinase [Coccidioides immitis RS]|uniref:non-specific serine/threonine protein kinase n=2 Tax=Coccidioides immitis TaxID=5501 RepID=A0A0E1S0B5_COCIM|nr:HASPIN protein kinase [Coccidioides immitis RS]EAS37075.1 HASPIN protein kinase [Coccidioides immitis RS]
MISSKNCVNMLTVRPINSPKNSQNRPLRSKRLYGKRDANSARAALDIECKSSSRTHRNSENMSPEADNLVETLQEKLAGITLEEQSPKKLWTKKRPRIGVQIRQASPSADDKLEEENCKVSTNAAVTQNHDMEERHREAQAETPKPDETEKEQKGNKRKVIKSQPQARKSDLVNHYVRPILEEAMSTREVEDFDTWAERAGDMFDVEKIAEGSYGEVYQLRVRQDISRRELSKSKAARLKAYDNGVFKIVPLRAQRGAGSKKFTSIQEIVAEVQMLKLLDAIPGFARFRDVHVVQGRFPASYQEAWTRYSETRDDCYNPDPSKKKSYPDNQVWAILEMDNAGYELEKFDCSSIFQIYDIFWGVALGLARAEQFAAFEHRDLHLGNICIKSTKPKGCLHGPLKPSSQNPGIGTGFGLSGIETTIIDYSLSRANLKISDIPVDEDIAWSDLDKKKLFDAIGRDDDEKLLRDTYRLMRTEVYKDQIPCRPRDEPWRWKEFSPKTNLIWLSFILTMLLVKGSDHGILPTPREPLTALSVNANTLTPAQKGKSGAKAKSAKKNHLPGIDFQLELLDRLQTVLDVLDPEEQDEECDILSCAGDLVAFAIGSQWLSESDFSC